MFSKSELEGMHHTCLKNLQRAAQGGCKICIGLARRRDDLGSNPEAEDTSTPFLQYYWKSGAKSSLLDEYWEISFDSKIPWLKWGALPFNHVEIHASHTDGLVPEWYLKLSEYAARDLDSQPWKVRRELFPLRKIPESTGHDNVLELGKRWLKNCAQSHSCEVFSGSIFDFGWYPKRLIDVTDPTSPRLLETQFEPPSSHYATLSHCWGINPDFVTLTTENLAEFRSGITIDILPASFREAMIICHKLAVRYIWIDSLCILQDSQSDWLLHAAEMSSVYRNCYLNLSFDAAENPRQGAFRRRDPDIIQECVAFSTIPRDLKLASVGSFDPFGSDSESCGSLQYDDSNISSMDDDSNETSRGEADTIKADPTNTTTGALRCLVFVPELDYLLPSTQRLPLSRRAWVVQERLLSTRVLHFMNDRIRWECGTDNSLQEGLPYGLPGTGKSFDQYSKSPFNCYPEDTSDRRQWHHVQHWFNLIRLYSNCLLTYPEKDKLAAWAAIAQRFAAVFGEEYYAGHFRKNMPFDLVWEVHGRPHNQDSARRRYPTWSWTSVDTEVICSSAWWSSPHSLVVIDDVSLTLADQSYKYGPVMYGQLNLRCLIVKCELGTRQDGYTDDVRKVCLQEVTGYDRFSVETDLRISLDARGTDILEDTYLIPLVEGQHIGMITRAVTGIILVKQTNDFYGRVGYWDTDTDGRLGLDCRSLFDFLETHSDNHRSVVIV